MNPEQKDTIPKKRKRIPQVRDLEKQPPTKKQKLEDDISNDMDSSSYTIENATENNNENITENITESPIDYSLYIDDDSGHKHITEEDVEEHNNSDDDSGHISDQEWNYVCFLCDSNKATGFKTYTSGLHVCNKCIPRFEANYLTHCSTCKEHLEMNTVIESDPESVTVRSKCQKCIIKSYDGCPICRRETWSINGLGDNCVKVIAQLARKSNTFRQKLLLSIAKFYDTGDCSKELEKIMGATLGI